MNESFLNEYSENRRILPFFKTGTVSAECWASGEMVRQKNERKEITMFFTTETTNKIFAAAFSLVLSTAVMAATIIPASPALFA